LESVSRVENEYFPILVPNRVLNFFVPPNTLGAEHTAYTDIEVDREFFVSLPLFRKVFPMLS